MADFEAIDRRLAELGLPHRMVVYEGAPHSFFDRGQEFWADACANAWGQMLTFIDNPTGA
jgi:carboxymethylenebutenolidase